MMQILVSQIDGNRKLALVSENFALEFKPAVGNSCTINLVHKSELKGQNYKILSKHNIFGFIGLIEIDNNIFIGTITGCAKVANPTPRETVNKIYAVDFFCLNNSSWDFMELDAQGRPVDNIYSNSAYSSSSVSVANNLESDEIRENLQQHPCFSMKKLLSNGSFYYSSDFDLTSILQKRGFDNYSLSYDNFEKEYMWNSFMMDEVITYRDQLDSQTKEILDLEGFLTTVIRGFAETFITYVNRLKLAITIISKQSWKRAGTRFNVRGIDDDGNVANFVETEFILHSQEYCCSFTQIRGSIPIFWEQDTALINPKIQITRSIEATQQAFDSHFIKLLEKYGPVNVVNLLSNKPSELELTKRYRRQINSSKAVKLNEDIFLTEFDFHKETAQEGFVAAKRLLPYIKDDLLHNGYFSYDVREKKVLSKQNGVFRVNCLDCLDRTNFIQQLISSRVLKLFLDDFKLNEFSRNCDDEDFMQKHNVLWADHGDQISQIYAGTNALKSSYTRKGKMSLAGVISDATKSVSRMYINNFMDKGKQQNIDLLLGRLPHQRPVELYNPANEYAMNRLNEYSSKFTTYSNMDLFVGTFNVSGMSDSNADLSEWLFPIGNKFKPDVVVLGLQEVIELTAGSILNADYTKSSLWENLVTKCLNQYDEKYTLLRVEQMSSLIILLFVKEDNINFIKHVEGSTKKTGFGGMTGNKGAVAIRFRYGDSSFCFVNAHLSAGVNNVDERSRDYLSINKNILFSGGRTISQHDSIIWLGDLNYRISLDNVEVRRELYNRPDGYIERLLQYDQLTQVINSNKIFVEFNEPTLQFHPTYKYDFGTDSYDTSEKERTPSWTDRIIYKGENLNPLAYSDAPLRLSDHKPVYAAYRTKISLVDVKKKSKLIKELSDEYNVKNQVNLEKAEYNNQEENHTSEKPTRNLGGKKSISESLLTSKLSLVNFEKSISSAPPNPPRDTTEKFLTTTSNEPKLNKKIPPKIPLRKAHLQDKTISSAKNTTKSSSSISSFNTSSSNSTKSLSLKGTPTPPPPPASRMSTYSTSESNRNSTNRSIEMQSLTENFTEGSKTTRRPLPPLPLPKARIVRPTSTELTSKEEEDVRNAKFSPSNSIRMSRESSSPSSSILEMVIDSPSSSKPLELEIRSNQTKTSKKSAPPPVPKKKIELSKI